MADLKELAVKYRALSSDRRERFQALGALATAARRAGGAVRAFGPSKRELEAAAKKRKVAAYMSRFGSGNVETRPFDVAAAIVSQASNLDAALATIGSLQRACGAFDRDAERALYGELKRFSVGEGSSILRQALSESLLPRLTKQLAVPAPNSELGSAIVASVEPAVADAANIVWLTSNNNKQYAAVNASLDASWQRTHELIKHGEREAVEVSGKD